MRGSSRSWTPAARRAFSASASSPRLLPRLEANLFQDFLDFRRPLFHTPVGSPEGRARGDAVGMAGSSRTAALPHDRYALVRAEDAPTEADCARAQRHRRASHGNPHAGASNATAALLRRGRGRSADQVEEQERRGKRRSPRSAARSSKCGAMRNSAYGVVHCAAGGQRLLKAKAALRLRIRSGSQVVGGGNATGSAIEAARRSRCRRMATPAANNALLQGRRMGEG